MSVHSCRTSFAKGDFQGSKPTDAYFVKCDNETTTQNDINVGIVNVLVGFAPLKPAEFVIIQIQQMARQIARKEAQSHATVHRGYTALRPVQNFKFRVKWDGKYVAGVSKVGTLSSARHPRSRIRRSFFWTELDAWSRRMLLEVHQLAIRYGWSEPEILSLTPLRRQFYLEMAGL